ncbi:MAG TPA: hypothetical protein ENH55_12240 [Aurantimonas coralicida]|uniref:Uncharacterized protein n=2 Tax=root TaxID=1 RepID=A0A9C9TIQ5_9HYPH|nr:hypothetical protein [Aurantimonas coralicida]HEU02597.1 hypothetical protein [Aurantimonas coralicida]
MTTESHQRYIVVTHGQERRSVLATFLRRHERGTRGVQRRSTKERDTMTTESISLGLTWQGVLPMLLAALVDGTDEGKRIAREELARMAKAADMAARDSTK